MKQIEMFQDTPLALPDKPTRDQIHAFEDALAQTPEGIAPVDHVFAKGMYARCMNLPKGTIATGKIHATEHINILAYGELDIWYEGNYSRIKAPTIFVSKPNVKKIAHAIEDSVIINIHPTDKTDVDEIEKDVILEWYTEEVEQ